MDSIGSYQGIFNQSSITTDVNELIITGLIDNKVIGSIGGILTNVVLTDGLDEGKTNLYFTTARARAAFTAGTNITLAAGVIATSNNPTFSVGATIGTLNLTNMSSNISNGLSLGSSAGTAGSYNVYLGQQAGGSATGGKCVGIGYQTLAGATGDNCFGLGFAAGFNSKTSGNVCIGSSTGQNLLTGSGYNIYIGSGAPSSSSASYEIVIGGSPAGVVGKGDSTCFISAGSGLYVSNLSTGVLRSSAAGLITSNATTDDLTEGKTNLYYTDTRARAAITATQPIFAISGVISLGYNTSNLTLASSNLDTIQDIDIYAQPQFARLLSSSISSRNVLHGTNAGISISTGVDNVAIGHNALTAITTTGTNTAVGGQALRHATGDSNTGIGFYALQGLTTGNQNTAIGGYAGSSLSTGSFNTLMGLSAGNQITTGGTNYCLGLNAGYSITTSSDNIALGAYAMARNIGPITTTNGRNIAIGHYAAHSLEGTPSNNIAIGYNTLYSATNSTNNTVVGSISAASTTTASNNTIIGASCMNSNVTGSNNTIIGYNSGQNINGGVYNIHIGSGCQASALNASSEVIIAGTSGTTVGMGSGTCYISSPYGLFSYSPAYCQLRSTAFNNGIVTWQFWSDGTTTYNNGFQLLSSNTQVVQPFPGLYEVNVSGSAQAQSSLYCAIDLLTNNVKYQNIAYQSSSGISTFIVNVSGSQLSRPVVSTPINSGWLVYLTGGKFFSLDFPLFMTIKFISL